ncbi:hypothetical protein C4D34_07885 [Clostridium perfringens]
MDFKISVAKFIHDGIEEEIKANDITTRELYYEKYKGNLYCKEIGCKAKLHHVDLNNGSRFFRTNRGNNPHKEKCPSEVLYDGTTTYSIGNGEAVEVPDKHIKGTLDRRRKAHKDKVDVKSKLSRSGNMKERKRNGTPKKPIGVEGGVNPSLNGGGKTLGDDKKGTRIMGREPQQITEKDFDKPRCVDGYIRDIFIHDDYIEVEFRERGEYRVLIEFGEAFKDNNISAFNGLKAIKRYFEYAKRKEEEVYCVCVGLVKERSDKVVIEVYKEIEFEIEGSIITQFIIINSNLM